MTLSPYLSRIVEDAEGAEYQVPLICSHPKCANTGIERHHMHRRSGGTRGYWVEVDGHVLPNIVGLCPDHHADITGEIGGHRARILWLQGEFWWFALDPLNFTFAPLDPQPPGLDEHDLSCPACARPLDSRKLQENGVTPSRSADEDLEPKPPRPRRVWSAAVPKDHYEDGYVLVETLVFEAAKLLGRAEHKSYAYFTLIEVLADFVDRNKDRSLDEVLNAS